MFQILGAILILGVVLIAVYFMRVDSIVDSNGEEAAVSIYKEMEEEEALYGELPGATIIEEDTNRPNDSCSFELVENVPYDLAFEINSTAAKPLYQAWMRLLDVAQEKIHVASYYWSLTGKDINVNDSSSKQGEDILKRFEKLLAENISVYVAASMPTLATNSTDLELLEEKGAHVKKIDFGHLAGGVLHSKFWIVDMKHIYIGSANMDWRSLSQVKEFGAVIYNCSCLAKDLWKTFSTYWDLGHANATIPFPWPLNYSTHINKHRPLEVEFNGVLTKAYFSASPPVFCPEGRTHDLFAIISIISEAQKFVYVSVMEYFPTSRFVHPERYWPAIDNALRRAAFNYRVQIRLLVSCWTHSDPAMLYYLRSLRALNNPQAHISVDVAIGTRLECIKWSGDGVEAPNMLRLPQQREVTEKLFIVPVLNHTNIPHGRVNHNKYMVTDKVAYIGTSNWSEDYFVNTAGVGLIIKQNLTNLQRKQLPIQEQLKNLFERDWNSEYAVNLEDVQGQKDCNWRGRL
ncbi:5'-3' exonuclease PLD4 isoform X2 [Accipiter gentilis]|uniref:5'-3' exonuclease PLD4 isoform X2 n=1 Tax=Astur gentilis TaxID=8957 RepID=UPI002110731C|nr:5'-3' exonuclease PLD4 isoform X2 [Accipiter gentilis]